MMNPRFFRPTQLILLMLAALLLFEPALANKFETIGSGVAGSSRIKAEYMVIIGYVSGGVLLFTSLLSFLMANTNAQNLNYALWKQSSGMLLFMGLVILGFAFFA
ncbi:MAG: hypothetical protein JMN27_12340 [gamma proteobacterium endosymbiont of Lamellibrachia anaximandri]|nr:hypothetical protein [gamma proteobacterium endosymbiont of Lamellibrachia anaximandri]MBL3534608.1 hypothetical protein [gamma proteobacterium endosymbiont of Lamellibrachia anaximandri]